MFFHFTKVAITPPLATLLYTIPFIRHFDCYATTSIYYLISPTKHMVLTRKADDNRF